MAERSQFWNTGTTGDGTTTISEAQTTEWFRDIMIPFSSSGPNTSQGVLTGVLNELVVSGASSPAVVATGAAVVEGFYYKNDASVSVAIPTPAAATRVDVVVLRASHSTTRTVRITRIAGTEGAGVPSLTQTAGTTWDIPLANVSITTGGVMTITDRRTFCYFATKVKTAMLDAQSVTNAKIRNSAGVSVIGRSANSVGAPADIAAAADNQVLKRASGTLSFAQVATADVANDAIDDTKIGNRVAQFYRRQGGSALNWSTFGTTTQIPTFVREQVGIARVTITTNHAMLNVTYPASFSDNPIVLVSLQNTVIISTAIGSWLIVNANNVGPTGFTIELYAGVTANAVIDVAWRAFGPE